jgi:3'-phosphoadenosine 5'-phosphosulfate sulfotransferase (PAPS reductase)/FAD synthetase
MSENRRAIQWRPIIDWSEKQVWDIIAKHKIQPHPCYELGWGRCSCQMCIFSSANTWASLQEISPDKVERIVEIEKDLGHSLYNEYEKVPTDKVWKTGPKIGQPVFKKGRKLDNVYEAKVKLGKSFISQATKDRWLDEALGEFTSPIFVDEWKLPVGAFNAESSGAD